MQMLWWCSWAQTVHSCKASSSAYCKLPDLLRVKYNVEKLHVKTCLTGQAARHMFVKQELGSVCHFLFGVKVTLKRDVFLREGLTLRVADSGSSFFAQRRDTASDMSKR